MIKIFNSINLKNVLEIPEDNKIFIEGYAMHFNVANHNGEMVLPGAFDRFFQELEENKLMPIFNAFHKSDLIVGAWTSIKQDETGLWVEGFLDLSIKEVADNIAPLVRNGALSNLSTEGWIDYKDIEEREDYYIVKNMILTGISLVAIGADMNTKFSIKNDITPSEEQKNEDPEPKSKNSLLFFI